MKPFVLLSLITIILCGCGMSEAEKKVIANERAEALRIKNVNEALRKLRLTYDVSVFRREGGKYQQHFLIEGSVENTGKKPLTAIHAQFTMEHGLGEKTTLRVNLLDAKTPLARGKKHSFSFEKMIQQKTSITETIITQFVHRGRIVSVEF